MLTVRISALSRNDKKVLHLDKNQFYGGSLPSYSFKDFSSFNQLLENNNDNEYHNSFQNFKFPSTSELDELSMDARTSNQFTIELFPKIVWNRSPLVDTLIRSGVSRYLEFKCIRSSYIYINGALQVVPWGKGDIFKNKFISLFDKRNLMKFIQSIDSPTSTDIEEYEQFKELPFIDYLTHKKFSDILKTFILYSIALLDDNQDTSEHKISTEEGYTRVKLFISCMGRFSENSPWIFPLYGTTDIHQSFCRLSAVYGATFILAKHADNILIDSETNKCNGIKFNDQILNCKFLISNPENASRYVENSQDFIHRCVIVTDKSFGQEDNDCSVIHGVIPPDTFNNKHSIYLLQFDHLSCVTPKNKYLIHLWTKGVNSESVNPLEDVVSKLFENEERKSALLVKYFFDKVIQVPKKDIPSNIYMTQDVDSDLSLDRLMEEAKSLFEKICPGEEFIPEVPNPEDIIWENDVDEEGNENDENLKQ